MKIEEVNDAVDQAHSTEITNEAKEEKKDDFSTPDDAIPVTILSGFLGAGKTTLLRHVLESTTHQLKVAVIVNDMAELNIDGELVRQVKKEVITLQNGCICCTLRGDLIREINRIQELGGFDYILIESTGIAEPQQVAESFCADPQTATLAKSPEQMLWRVARLDTCVTVIDCLDFPIHMKSLQRFKDKYNDGLDIEDPESEEGEKPIANLLVEQVEFANVILLNKTDLVSNEELESIKTLIRSLNPNAILIATQYGAVEPSHILNTRLFRMEDAQLSPGWLQSLIGTIPSHSESVEYGVSSFVYRSRRPFHPARLFQWVDKSFVFTLDWHKENKDSMKNAIRPSSVTDDKLTFMQNNFGVILRSKGFVWFADHDRQKAGWAHTGRLFCLDRWIPWYATVSEDQWGITDPEALARVKSKFEVPYGDRRQEIVFIGTNLNKEAIVAGLDSCLLVDEEMKKLGYLTKAGDRSLPSSTKKGDQSTKKPVKSKKEAKQMVRK